MKLLFDVGNSNTNFTVYDDQDESVGKWRIRTDTNKTADEYSIILNPLINEFDIEVVVISSVVPIVTVAIEYYVTKYLKLEPLILSPGIKTGLDIRINNPKEIGADIVATAVGAIKKYPQPMIVIDMGTATKVTYVDNNTFYGGAIVPGIETSLHGLVSRTALLPHQIELKAPKKVIEKETIACMQSGLIYGNAAMLDGLIERFEQESGKKCYVVATGGLAKYVIPYCRHQVTLDKNLIYDGLLEIYYKNQV